MAAPENAHEIFGIPATPAWFVVGWLFTASLSFWLGRLSERLSKQQKARERLTLAVRQVQYAMNGSPSLTSLWRTSYQGLADAALSFGNLVRDSRRIELEAALRRYRDIQEPTLGCEFRTLPDSNNRTPDYTRAHAAINGPLNEILRIAKRWW